MQTLRLYRICATLLICAFSLVLPGCDSVNQIIYKVVPPPALTVIPEPTAYVGQVGQRTAHSGWAVTVTNVKRSDLNPQQITPQAGTIDDEYDYVYMDVLVERTIDERSRVSGTDFTLVDGSGKEYGQGVMRNWEYQNYDYHLNTTGEDRIAFYLPRSAQDLTLRLAPFPTIPQPIEVALDEVSAPRRIDLQQAIEMGLITTGVRGISLESIEVEISLKIEEELELTILPGTTFLAPSPDLQSMVVRRQMYIFLEDKDEVSLEVSVACANMHLEAPSGGEEYIVKIEPPAEALRKLMGLPEFQDSSFRLQQFAIWTITDKPARGQYVGLGSGDQGSPPSASELETIAAWFQAAGLSLTGYPSLNR